MNPEKKFLSHLGGAEYLTWTLLRMRGRGGLWTDLFSLVREMQQMLSTRAIPTSEAVLLQVRVRTSASKRSIRRFVITEKAPTRAFFWLKGHTGAFTMLNGR